VSNLRTLIKDALAAPSTTANVCGGK
jgi:hypothetical protein